MCPKFHAPHFLPLVDSECTAKSRRRRLSDWWPLFIYRPTYLPGAELEFVLENRQKGPDSLFYVQSGGCASTSPVDSPSRTAPFEAKLLAATPPFQERFFDWQTCSCQHRPNKARHMQRCEAFFGCILKFKYFKFLQETDPCGAVRTRLAEALSLLRVTKSHYLLAPVSLRVALQPWCNLQKGT